MKKVLGLIFIVACLVLWLYAAWQPEPKTSRINQVSLQPVNQDTEAKAKQTQNAEPEPVKNTEPLSPSADNNLPLESGGERTFMAIYRDIKLAEDCSNFYRNHHGTQGNYDYLAVLQQAREYQFQTDQAPPATQVQALENWVQQCLNLKAAVFFRADINQAFPDYQFAYPVLVELRKEWRQTQPQSAAEKHLAKTFQVSEKWRQSLNRLLQISRGDFFYTKGERETLKLSVTQLQRQTAAMYQLADQANRHEIDLLHQQISALQEQMNQRLPVDEVQRAEAIDTFNQLTYYMEQAMYDGFPESFVLAVKTLESTPQFDLRVAHNEYRPYQDEVEELITEYTPPSQHLFSYAKTQDHAIFDLLIEPASHLMLCYMGADCSAESEWVRYYCLGNDYHETTYPSACGKSLLDFYTDDYLSPNLWQDVSQLFDKMVYYYES